MALLDELISGISKVSESINTNALVTGARSSMESGLKSFMITAKEKASIQANFEMQFTGGVINKIVDSVLSAAVQEAQIESIQLDIALKEKELKIKEAELKIQEAQLQLSAKELLLKQAQIDVMLREITAKEALNAAQVRNQDADTSLKGSQKALVDQQKLTEVQTTTKVQRESELLISNKALVDAQKLTQEKQRLDIMASINVKNEQALSTRQSALFEEARKHVLIASTLYNNQIQKSKEENNVLNAMALDTKFVLTDAHLLRVKNALDGITVTPISYTTELTTTVGVVNAGI